MGFIDFLEEIWETLLEYVPRLAACLALAVAGCVFVVWLVPGVLKKILFSLGLLAAGSLVGLIWEGNARRAGASKDSD